MEMIKYESKLIYYLLKTKNNLKNRKVQSIASEINKTNQVPQQILRENEKQILLK